MSLPTDLQSPVGEVAKLLEGKSVALIGGDPRADAARRIKEAFRLKDVVWKANSFTFDKDECEALVSRDDVAVVILMVRWSRFEFRRLGPICRKHGKLLIRLPGGYNPHQIADQFLRRSNAEKSRKKAAATPVTTGATRTRGRKAEKRQVVSGGNMLVLPRPIKKRISRAIVAGVVDDLVALCVQQAKQIVNRDSQDCDRLKAENAALQSENDRLTERLRELDASNRAARTALRRKEYAAHDKIADLTADLDRVRERLGRLTKQNRDWEHLAATVKADIDRVFRGVPSCTSVTQVLHIYVDILLQCVERLTTDGGCHLLENLILRRLGVATMHHPVKLFNSLSKSALEELSETIMPLVDPPDDDMPNGKYLAMCDLMTEVIEHALKKRTGSTDRNLFTRE